MRRQQYTAAHRLRYVAAWISHVELRHDSRWHQVSVITGETHGPFSIVDDSLVILTIGENWDGRWVETRENERRSELFGFNFGYSTLRSAIIVARTHALCMINYYYCYGYVILRYVTLRYIMLCLLDVQHDCALRYN